MKRLVPPSALAAALLAGALLATSAGGAVAGALITSAQIKNGTITSADLKNKTIRSSDISAPTLAGLQSGSRPISGYELVVEDSASVAAGALATVEASCPAGKVALGSGAFWVNTYSAPQVFPIDAGASETTWIAGGSNNSGSADRIRFTLVCADAD